MLGLDAIEVMTPSGHPSIINKIKTHARACLLLNIAAVGSVVSMKYNKILRYNKKVNS